MVTQTEQNLADVATLVADLRNASLDRAAALADGRLRALCRRVLDSEKSLKGRVMPRHFRSIVHRTLTTRFLEERRPVDEMQVARMLSSAVRFIRQKLETRPAFLPTHLQTVQTDATIRVGPVTFHPMTTFAACHPDLSAPWIGQYDQVAEIEIPGCDADMAQFRAEQALRRTHDLLRLLIACADPRADDADVVAWTDLTGRLPQQTLEDFGRCLTALSDPEATWPLSERLLDAVGWYAMAAREPADAAALTLLVNALERLTMTREGERITDCVAERAAHLYIQGDPMASLADSTDLCNTLYSVRCALVHGAVGPYAPDIPDHRVLAEKVTRTAILGALQFYQSIGLWQRDVSTNRLEDAYQALEQAPASV